MKRAAEGALAALAALLAGAFLWAVAGGGGGAAASRRGTTADARYFHPGKAAPTQVENGGCRTPECHVAVPHAKDPTQAAFRNMHVAFVGCTVCHGGSRNSWTVRRQPPVSAGGGAEEGVLRNRWILVAATPAVDRDRPHPPLGPALRCRACHSEEGAREIGTKGAKELAPGFIDPVALRMIEGGAKQWIPDTMR